MAINGALFAYSRAGVVHLGPGGRQRVLLQHVESLQLQLGIRVAAGAPALLAEVVTLVIQVPFVWTAQNAL